MSTMEHYSALLGPAEKHALGMLGSQHGADLWSTFCGMLAYLYSPYRGNPSRP